MSNAEPLCPVTTETHHYHSDKSVTFYVGTSYMALCCHCGRVQMIVYHGRQDTPDLHGRSGPDCGPFYRT